MVVFWIQMVNGEVKILKFLILTKLFAEKYHLESFSIQVPNVIAFMKSWK